jgi:hypothetical protein
MNHGDDLVERRTHTRFRVQRGAFVTPRAVGRKLWQIIDISKGGLAFRYIAQDEEFERSSELDIITRDTVFSLEKVPFTSVSDFETADKPFLGYETRRHGVQFGTLTHNQKSRLEYFIQNHTIGED